MKTIQTYAVNDILTAEILSGSPSPELVRASLGEKSGTGAVCARREGNCWVLAEPGTEGERTVYVTEADVFEVGKRVESLIKSEEDEGVIFELRHEGGNVAEARVGWDSGVASWTSLVDCQPA